MPRSVFPACLACIVLAASMLPGWALPRGPCGARAAELTLFLSAMFLRFTLAEAYAIFVALSAEQHYSVWMDPAVWILTSGEAGEEQGHLSTSMVTR